MYDELEKYEDKMEKTVQVLEGEFISIRAGRANPHVLDKVTVDYYGQPTPLNQVGNITVPEARVLMIQPWDVKIVKDIERALHASDIGITPNSDGKIIRLIFPELTEERRMELTKDIKKKGEESKIAIRNIRRDAIDHFKRAEKAHEITEDDLKDLEDQTQKLTDRFILDIDNHVTNKTKEIMTV
jgi:ribosome recycling factor